MKYRVIDTQTGKDAIESYGGCEYVVTPEGLVAWWDDSQGWEIDKDQSRWIVLLEPANA